MRRLQASSGRMKTAATAGAVLIGICSDAASARIAPPGDSPAGAQTTTTRPAPAQLPPTGQSRVNPDAVLLLEFTKRVEEYAALHKKLENTLPKLSKEATPHEIDKFQRALGRLIQESRAKAQPGDIFTKDMRAYFRRQLTGVFAGPEGARLRADILESIMDENPGPIRLRVNARYPDTVPVSTMSPQVLAALPKLPDDLEYRFIGERLILLDVHGHIIVDYIEEALPR